MNILKFFFPLAKILDPHPMYRWVPLHPNVDNSNSQTIQRPVETTSQSPQCYSECFLRHLLILNFFVHLVLFVRIKRDLPL